MIGGQVSWTEYLFSSAGRIGRRAFVAGVAGLVAAAFAVRTLTPAGLAWTGWLTYAPILFCAACLVAKRLHDVGRTGWWGGIVLLAAIVMWNGARGLGGFVGLLVLAWAGVELLLVPGEAAMNRYGPREISSSTAPPRGPATA